MEQVRVLLVDAFTDEPLAGNVAGVVPEADGLADEQMQAIARELGASETGFLLSTGAADRRVRFFTPTAEVDLCGHATVASHAVLALDGTLDAGHHTLETAVGVLDIELEESGMVWMAQEQPSVRQVEVDPERLGEVLGITTAAIAPAELTVARASTGLPFLIVPVDYLSALGEATPDFDRVTELSEQFDVAGIYAFTFDTLEGHSTIHGRMWAPALGVDEDPVTGTASGAAGAYLRHVGAFDRLPDEMVFEQGHFIDRPGEVHVRVGDEITVGGRATVSVDGRLTVPDIDPDDIIEA